MKKSDDEQELYPLNDLIVVGLGIPIVLIVAIFCANFITSLRGI